ncbi:methionine--tRNA ligase, cytoplasmic [Episyrphus balteatus]|uniref:methionine--tRNA ligase, cytoplasmic n=1 Tax=Episyrphus balteatus TaxID=286459 RepID=UPI002485C6F2|nr:methionine--tRNA ligase, cytoplasmic [Episyrphus balteatus]
MIIYTNEGNPFGLNLLVLTKFAKKNASVKKINLNDPAIKGLKQLPILELDCGLQLFSTTAAAKLLFPNEGKSRDEWLEWSATQLAPALAHNMGVGHRADPNALPVLNALVKKLDDRLKVSPFLAGDKITTADLCVWCLLAPDGTLKGAQNIENLLVWYRKITALPEIKAALDEQPLKELSFNSLQHSNRFGGLHHVVLSTPGDDSSKLLAESGGNIAETVTEEEKEAAGAAFVFNKVNPRKEPRTVLPKKGERNVLITSALPYVNNVPHLGNIIGCVLSADIFARYARTCGYNTLYVCGTDEYGTATENKALAEGLTPKEICDKYFELHNSIYRWFGIGFDYFGRTTTAEQTEVVQEAFQDIYKAGFILTESVEQLLCQKCDRFLADRFVEGTCPHPGCGYEDARGDQCDKCGKLVNAIELIRPRCKTCNTAPVIRSSEQLFIDLPKIEPKLKEWIEKSDSGWTNNARVITRSWLREGLKPRCITRDLKWGIPVPLKGFESKVFYVWFDAPYGYVSITKRYSKDHYTEWWQPAAGVNVELFQFMAKDNVPFHSVMFPSSLLATNKGHVLASHIMATEYLNYEDGKFSKSRGIGVFGNDAQETGIPADVWRFYLASARPEGQDSSFSWNDLGARNNSELLNNLGNFVNRALVFCEKNYDSTIPPMTLTKDELILLALVNREVKGYVQSLEKARLRDGIRHILSISRHGNGYMQSQQPWVLLKGTDDEKARAATIIGLCCNIACLLASLLFPYMPTTARTLFDQLNTKQPLINPEQPLASILLPAGHKIGKPAPLFAKIEQARIDELKKKYAGPQVVSSTSGGALSVAELEKAIAEQGDKVRALKQSKADKAVWQPEVNILLDLKKKLEAAQAAPPAASSSGSASVAELEKAIAAQGDAVRALKQSKADKSVVQPQVNILLDLKKQLAAAQAAQASPAKSAPATNSLSVTDMEKAVSAQGEKVRALKQSKADKSVWQPEVNILLDLKKQLAAAQAQAPAETTPTVTPTPANDDIKIKELEEKIAKQGEKVRELKSSSDAAVWKPEVEVLLALKKELSAITGVTESPASGKNKKKK